MKITVLTHLEKERDEKSYDVVVDHVMEGLRSLDHDVCILGVHGDLEKLIKGLDERKPELVFNLMETFGKTHLGAVGAMGLLELIGVPHTDFGEGVTAVVVKDKKAPLDEQAVMKALDGRLAKFKMPKKVIFVDDLPRNTMGKVQKNVLRDTYAKIYAGK